MNPLDNQITLEQAKQITERIIGNARGYPSVFQAEELNNKGDVWQIKRYDVGEARWSAWGGDVWCTFGAREFREGVSYPMVYLHSFVRCSDPICSDPIFWDLYAAEDEAVKAAFAQGAEAVVKMWLRPGEKRVVRKPSKEPNK